MRKLLFALLFCGWTTAAPALDRQAVEFARPGGKALRLDLHVPDGAGPFPAAILVHGGGFDEGSRSTNPKPLFQPLADAGYAWFSVDYRLAPEFRFPEACDDIDAAIRWVKAHASEYRVDPARIALIGESAGGFLVNYAGTHYTPETRVAAVVDFYGPSDYEVLSIERREHPERFNMVSIRRHFANGGGMRFFGAEQLDAEGLAKLRAVAPIHAVHKGMPPFLAIHGADDNQVPFSQSVAFCEAIRKAGSECRLVTVQRGGHGMGWKEPSMQHWRADMIAWLNGLLQPGRAAASPTGIEVSDRRAVAASREFHYAFPRMIRGRSGDLLLFYKIAQTHVSDPSVMVVRRSKDNGATWSEPVEYHRDPKPDHSATNTVPLLLPSGRILNWLSSYGFQRPATREPTYLRWSDDDAVTWSPPARFDTDPSRSTYYVTDAINTSDGVLACAATFPPSFIGNCWAAVWHSKDGKSWRHISNITSPKENRGDEVALLETAPGRILCLLRSRQVADNPYRKGLARFVSADGGRTWKEEANLEPQLGCTLQRPFLTRVDSRTILLTGRDYDRKLVVAYVSRDNGETFGERRVIDRYVGDGAYTSGVTIGKGSVLLAYYSDVDSAPNKPDIYTVKVNVLPKR